MQERTGFQGLVGRLRGLSLRTHLWLATLPLLIGLLLVLLIGAYRNYIQVQNLAADDLAHETEDLAGDVQAPVEGIANDLQFFTNFLRNEERFNLSLENYDPSDPAALLETQEILAPLSDGLRVLMQSRPNYTYVAILTLDGQELLRVERDPATETVSTLPPNLLQNEAGENYVQEGEQLRRNRVWISPVELRRERNGLLIEPYQTTVRFVTPLTSENLNRIGLLVFQVDVGDALNVINTFELENGLAFIIDDEGHYLAHNQTNDNLYGRDLPDRDQVTGELAEDLITTDSIDRIDLNFDDTAYIGATEVLNPFANVAGAVNNPSWIVLTAQDTAAIRNQAFVNILPLGAIGLVIILLTIGLLSIQTRAIRANLSTLQEGIRRVSIGDLSSRLPEVGENEFSDIHQSFNRSAGYMQGLIKELETSVQARIRDLDITAEITREVAGLRDVNLVLNRAINRVVERFDFYHAQVFLVDDLRENAVLVASTGDAGRRLLAKRHSLGVGSQSVIGRVTSLGVTVIAGDTLSTDVPWRPNVELPNTRAEMALPLKVEDVVIGALDIQSTHPDAFSPTDIEVFQVLGDQLAIAINNARLLEESTRRVEEIAELNARLTEQAWQEFATRKPSETNLGFRYNLMDVTEDDPASEAPAPTGDQTSVAITLRGIQVGEIATHKADLSEDEMILIEAVAERISLALDNARLFEETQLTLSESRRLYETARNISAASDLDLGAIYKIITDQIVYQETLDTVALLMAHPIPSPRASALMVAHQWSRQADLAMWKPNEPLFLLQEGLADFYQNTPREMMNFATAAEMTDMNNAAIKTIQTQLNSESLMILPLIAGVKWFGLLVLGSHRRRAFDGAFVNFALAVADQLAIAIENRRLLDEVQNEARRSLALAEAGQLANQISGDFKFGVGRLFRGVSDPGNFNRWWFGLLEPNSTLRMVDAYSPAKDEKLFETVILGQDNNALAAAVQLRQVILVNDFGHDHPLLGNITPQHAKLFGKHLAVPLQLGEDVLGALLIGRDMDAIDLNEDDIQLATTLASQLSIAAENQNLFSSIQAQQETLQTTLETMPAGVMLLDRSGQVLLINRRAVDLLGNGIREGFFAKDTFPIYYVDSDEEYAREDFPITQVLDQNAPAVAENISVQHPNGFNIDLLMNASPIRDAEGRLNSVVAVFQEITELRELEKALQASLSETTILYEASRNILSASAADDISPALIAQMTHLEADEIYLIVEVADELEALPPVVITSMPPLPVDEPVVSDIPLPTELLMPREQLFISDMNSPSIDPTLATAAQQSNVQAIASMPLSARGQVLGWFVAVYHQPHEFNTENRRFIGSLADQTAVALDSIRLFESTEKALQSVASLYQSSRRVAEAQGVTDVIEITREELMNFGPDRIDLLLQKSAEESDVMYFAINWAHEASLEFVPSLPVNTETAEALTDFDPFNRHEYYIENFLNDDSQSDLHEALYQLDTPYQAVISVPLRVGGRTIGRIGMGFLKPRRFNSDERQLISTLADSTAYVVENDLLLEQTQESLEETGVLYQASRTIANAETREEIVEALIDYAASAQVDKTILISLMTRTWDDVGSVIEITSTWGSEEVSSLQGLYFTRDQFPIWEQLSTEEILWFDDIDRSTEISENARMGYQAFGIAAVAIVPLRTPTGIIGCVVFGSSEPRRHEPREVRIYQALADQAAVQLENKRLFDQAEFRARQLATAAEVSRAVTSILRLEELFPRVVDLIMDAFDYDHVQIFMVDGDGKQAVVRASTGEAGRQLLSIKHSLAVGSQSVIGRVTSQGEPIIALDTTDPEVVHRPNPYLPETRSEMALPIFVQGRVVGALDVQSNRPQAFGPDDIQALTPLVDQLSVAIENARLFQLAQQSAEEMRFLFDVTTAAAAESELQTSLKVVLEILLNNIKTSSANVFLYNPLEQVLTSAIDARYDSVTEKITFMPPEEALSLPVGQGMIGWVAQQRQPLVSGDLMSDPRYFQDRYDSLSGLYVPLMAGTEMIGVLALESNRYNFFTEGHMRLMQALSTSLSAIIRNAQLLEEVQLSNDRLREIDQLKTNFLAAMSHELRTPLNSIIGFSRVILKGIDGPLTDMQEQDIQTIHDSGKHLLGLVNDILDQAKIEAGKMELVLEYFDVGAVINGVMATAIGLTQGKNVRLYTEIEEGLPQGFGDEFRTRQILFNLVSNAAKFTKEGSISIKARVVQPEDSIPLIQVGVTDSGIGIAEKDFDKLFEAFQQVDNTTTRAVEGTGLGLPLSRSLARLQGGDLWFDSEVGAGSTFYVSIPLGPAPQEGETLPQTGMLSASTESNGHATSSAEAVEPEIPAGRKILAVDDDAEVLDLYRRYLSRDGWYVIGTTEPEKVENLATEYAPEIILLDVNMPNRTGWQVLESLKASIQTSQIPVIICSIDDNRNRSGDLGAANHLVKPFMENDLVKAVRDLDKSEN